MKRFLKMFLMLSIFCFCLVPSVYAADESSQTESTTDTSKVSDYNRDDDFDTNCADFAPTIRMGGYLIFIVKIAVPLIIIVKSSVNLISVVTAGTPEELKKKAQQMGVSLIAGILIFLLPTILDTIFGFVDEYAKKGVENADMKICRACVFEPFSEDCSNHIK